MNSKTALIIRREYLERVKKKSFIITTLLMPVLMLALMAMPALIMEFAGTELRTVSVVDDSRLVADSLQSTSEIRFVNTPVPLEDLLKQDDVDAVLYIPADVMEQGKGVSLYTSGASSMNLESAVRSQLNSIIEAHRLRSYHIDNLDKILAEVQSDITLSSYRIDQEQGSKETSTMISYMLGIVLTMMLYMCLLLYGQMVMTSIIEEKNNRVLEIVVSSVKPTQLMLGKICGIGLVAVTQIVIWGVLISVMSAFVLPALLPASVAADVAAVNAGTADVAALTTDADLLSAVAMLGNVGYIIQIFTLLILFLVGGFLLYSAIYAAIGSAVDNIQDAGQLQSIIIIPIVLGIMFGMMAANDPTSDVSLWMSLIPFTSPMVMMARIPFGIPAWEIVVSLIVLYITFLIVVWIAAKIYRVGIFMYGKKPTLKELIRWARYK
ncbi:MAG: ABC transporter permease [Muribaculaceae bacterium]|nr:ABC transporter permease [Muribaculaceae bacterium]